MNHKLNLTRGDIVYIAAKVPNSYQYETDGGYAVVVSKPHKNRQKHIDVVWINHNSRLYAAAYPEVWHRSEEVTVQCGQIARIDRRRVLYVDGHCSKKEMMRIRSGIIGGYGLKNN